MARTTTWIPVAAAAKFAFVTPSAIYSKLERGELVARTVDGLRVVSRAEVIVYRKQQLALMRPRPKPRPQTEAEFIRELIANDPD